MEPSLAKTPPRSIAQARTSYGRQPSQLLPVAWLGAHLCRSALSTQVNLPVDFGSRGSRGIHHTIGHGEVLTLANACRCLMRLVLHSHCLCLLTPMAQARSLTRRFWQRFWINSTSGQVCNYHRAFISPNTSPWSNSHNVVEGMIARNLDLFKPRYLKTAAYGHFGREEPEFTWEKVIQL